MIVREETEPDFGPVASLLGLAFGGDEEARLVDRLREDGDIALALVAQSGREIVGHIVFSPMTAPFPALGLAPLGVRPDFQGCGVGSRLMHEGIRCAGKGPWSAIFVLGDPEYYRRFGFSVEAASGFTSPFAGPHFMLRALSSHLPVMTGPVDYAPAFSKVGSSGDQA